MASVWYCTREEVKEALDFTETAPRNSKLDRACAAGARAAEAITNRTFYPQIDTRYFDWPNYQYARSWKLWLDANEVVSVSSLVAGGDTIQATDYFLEPNTYGPPYSRVEIDLGSSASFNTANGTQQRSIAISGVFGYTDEVENTSTLAASGSSADTVLTVANATDIGVGSVLKINDEWVIVSEKYFADTTQNLQTPLTVAKNDVAVSVTDGTQFAPGDVLLLDSEKVKVVDIAGNTLTVVRAWDGSILAAHTGSDIYAYTALKVKRGQLGSVAASHVNGSVVAVLVVPDLIRQLAIAEAVNSLMQESSGYARSEAQESNNPNDIGRGLRGLRDLVRRRYARKARIRGV